MLPWIVHSIGSSCFSWIEWIEYEDRVLYYNEIALMSSPWSEERIGRRFQLQPSLSPSFDPVGHEPFSAPT